MIPYWIVFILPSIFALKIRPCNVDVQKLGYYFFGIIAILLIGLRYEVGGDWIAYLRYVDIVRDATLIEALSIDDPGYMFFNWISVKIGMGIGGVNTLCGFVFVYGLISFCKNQPFPWLAITIAVPYMLIVVSMGFSRQAVALGIVFIALSYWKEDKFIKYSLIILLASLFHKSAVVMFLIGLFMNNKYIYTKIMIALPCLVVISLILVINDRFDRQFNAYMVDKTYKSEGGLIRVLMNIVPSIIFFIYKDRFKVFVDYRLIKILSLSSVFCLCTVSILSMVTDRFALYLAPIQIIVLSRFPVLLDNIYVRTLFVFVVVCFYAIVLTVWLLFANHSEYWLPYKLIIFS